MKNVELLNQLEQTTGFLDEDIEALWLLYDEYFVYSYPKENIQLHYHKIRSILITLLKSLQYNKNLNSTVIKKSYSSLKLRQKRI